VSVRQVWRPSTKMLRGDQRFRRSMPELQCGRANVGSRLHGHIPEIAERVQSSERVILLRIDCEKFSRGDI